MTQVNLRRQSSPSEFQAARVMDFPLSLSHGSAMCAHGGLGTVPMGSLAEAFQSALCDPELREMFSENKESLKAAYAYADAFIQRDPGEKLSVDQIGALHAYTQGTVLSPIINARLRGEPDGTHLQNFLPFIKLLATAVNELPCATLPPDGNAFVFTGARGDVIRELGISSAVKNNIPVRVSLFGFVSAVDSYKTLLQQPFLGARGARTLFCITAMAGADIAPYSADSSCHAEILLPPGMVYEVTGKHTEASAKDEIHFVHLRQVIE